jgi:hypothetical protein
MLLGMTQRALALQGAFDDEEGEQVFEVFKKVSRACPFLAS